MIQENEIIMLLLGGGVFIFTLINSATLRRIPSWGMLRAAFHLFLLGLVFTIVEGFLLKDLLNYLEHLCYAANMVVVTIWCRRVFATQRGAD